MRVGVGHIVPFAAVSMALHAAMLVSATANWPTIAPAPTGDHTAVSVRLQGASAPEPAEPDTAQHNATRRDTPERLETADRNRTSVEPASPDATSGEHAPLIEAAHPGEPLARAHGELDPKPSSAPESRVAEPIPPEPQRARDSGQRASGADAADDRAQLTMRAREEVAVHFGREFRYPRIARQRGWEGHVLLAFRVHADGSIQDIEVVESSGHAVLDEAARQSLERIERVPELADRLDGAPLTLEIPVTYRLQSG